MRVRVVVGVALALVGAAVVVVLSQSGRRLAGTSFVARQSFSVFLPPGGTACQPGTYLPDDSAAAQLLIGTYGRPRPALTVTFTEPGGRLVAHGTLPGGAGQGDVAVPFTRVVRGDYPATTACVRSSGASATRVALAGDIALPAAAARIHGRPTRGLVAFHYLRKGRESWWELAPVVAQRFGVGKSHVFGTWTLPLLALVLVAVWLAVVRLLLRETA